MRLVLLGKPGSGKGTQARRIAAMACIPAVSTGDLIRQAISTGSPLGRSFQAYTDKGLLVPDSLVLAIIEARFLEPDCAQGFLLDGFPRTLVQAEALEKWLADQHTPLEATVNINVPDSALIERATGRRLCKKCGASYHVRFAAPKTEGICDHCQTPLGQRSDDRADVVMARVAEYKEKTAPLMQFYRARKILHDIDGQGTPDEVSQRISAVLAQQAADA
jgi:adenylate kinase